jgi:peroxiredoxin
MKTNYFKLSACLFFFIAFTSFSKAQSGYKVGDLASDFNLKNINEKMVSLAKYKQAKGFIVVFTCNHCPYAKAYERRIMTLDAEYAVKGYPVIAINPNDPKAYPEDSFENMQKRAIEKQYTFPYLIDETQAVAKAYGARVTPHVYLLQKTEKGLVVAYVGAIDNDTENINPNRTNYVAPAIEALLAGKLPSIAQTKAIGCSIKWKESY